MLACATLIHTTSLILFTDEKTTNNSSSKYDYTPAYDVPIPSIEDEEGTLVNITYVPTTTADRRRNYRTWFDLNQPTGVHLLRLFPQINRVIKQISYNGVLYTSVAYRGAIFINPNLDTYREMTYTTPTGSHVGMWVAKPAQAIIQLGNYNLRTKGHIPNYDAGNRRIFIRKG